MKTLNEKLEFVLKRFKYNGVAQVSPIMAVGWINYLHPMPGQEAKEHSVPQVTAAFFRLGNKGVIRRVHTGEAAWLDLWELV